MISNQSKITVVIPVLNEVERIEKTLLPLKQVQDLEIIVVDGGSRDETVSLVESLGITVISTSPGRAKQMNLGAKMAQGEILLFLHGDTLISPDYLSQIRVFLSNSNSNIVAGAFELKIDGEKWLYRVLEKMVNWRSHLFSLPYGDQAIFLTRELFWEIGGFQEIAIMEDFDLMQRLKQRGKIVIIPLKVITSDRRWRNLGIIKTTIINQLVILGYYLGISPTKLRKFYDQARGKSV
jgi:rSAM/selenodomain-associated transferase 2